ncbi:hypothetical protein B0H13DRAFT_1900188 [Mycena leptocephala]|nr:hypothetical protein B0H13DRAFT_1900188 [Mycena leptocephala]
MAFMTRDSECIAIMAHTVIAAVVMENSAPHLGLRIDTVYRKLEEEYAVYDIRSMVAGLLHEYKLDPSNRPTTLPVIAPDPPPRIRTIIRYAFCIIKIKLDTSEINVAIKTSGRAQLKPPSLLLGQKRTREFARRPVVCGGLLLNRGTSQTMKKKETMEKETQQSNDLSTVTTQLKQVTTHPMLTTCAESPSGRELGGRPPLPRLPELWGPWLTNQGSREI